MHKLLYWSLVLMAPDGYVRRWWTVTSHIKVLCDWFIQGCGNNRRASLACAQTMQIIRWKISTPWLLKVARNAVLRWEKIWSVERGKEERREAGGGLRAAGGGLMLPGGGDTAPRWLAASRWPVLLTPAQRWDRLHGLTAYHDRYLSFIWRVVRLMIHTE